MAKITCDMIISRETGHFYLQYPFKFLRFFQTEIDKIKFDQATLELI